MSEIYPWDSSVKLMNSWSERLNLSTFHTWIGLSASDRSHSPVLCVCMCNGAVVITLSLHTHTHVCFLKPFPAILKGENVSFAAQNNLSHSEVQTCDIHPNFLYCKKLETKSNVIWTEPFKIQHYFRSLIKYAHFLDSY